MIEPSGDCLAASLWIEFSYEGVDILRFLHVDRRGVGGEKMKKTYIHLFLCFLSAGFQTHAGPVGLISKDMSLFDIISQSRNCEFITSGNQCEYAVGEVFKISIAAIGTERAGIHFEKSNSSQPIYASFGISHGCVIVNRFQGFKGIPEFVFISPKNGFVYNSWVDCGAAL